MNLLLLGMSGSGKTATLKSIAMTEDVHAQGGWESAVGNCQQKQVVFGQKIVNIIDTPGLFSTQMTSEEDQKREFENSINKIFQMHPEGFHALILVFSYGRRFGQDDAQTMEVLKEVFGANWLRTHGVALITCGDKFKKDLKGESFEARCRKIPGPMGEIFKECNYRCVLFDNVTDDTSVIQTQRNHLISVVEMLGNTQHLFTHRNRVMSSSKTDPSPGFGEQQTQETDSACDKKTNGSKVERGKSGSSWGFTDFASKAFNEIRKSVSSVSGGGQSERKPPSQTTRGTHNAVQMTNNMASNLHFSNLEQNQKSTQPMDTDENLVSNTREAIINQKNNAVPLIDWPNSDQPLDQFVLVQLTSEESNAPTKSTNKQALSNSCLKPVEAQTPNIANVPQTSTMPSTMGRLTQDPDLFDTNTDMTARNKPTVHVSNIYPNLKSETGTIASSKEPGLIGDIETDTTITNSQTLSSAGLSKLNKETSAMAKTNANKQRDHTFLLTVRKDILDICVLLQRDIIWVMKLEKLEFQIFLQFYKSKTDQLKNRIESQDDFVFVERSLSALQRLLSCVEKEADNCDCLERLTANMTDNLHAVVDLLENDLDEVLTRWERVLVDTN